MMCHDLQARLRYIVATLDEEEVLRLKERQFDETQMSRRYHRKGWKSKTVTCYERHSIVLLADTRCNLKSNDHERSLKIMFNFVFSD